MAKEGEVHASECSARKRPPNAAVQRSTPHPQIESNFGDPCGALMFQNLGISRNNVKRYPIIPHVRNRGVAGFSVEREADKCSHELVETQLPCV
jgi:hypothetical protein